MLNLFYSSEPEIGLDYEILLKSPPTLLAGSSPAHYQHARRRHRH